MYGTVLSGVRSVGFATALLMLTAILASFPPTAVGVGVLVLPAAAIAAACGAGAGHALRGRTA